MIKGQYRQGDVLLEFSKWKITQTEKLLPNKDGKIVLAEGEVTGHAHAFLGGATLFRDEGVGSTYVKVTEPKSLLHEEHYKTPAHKGIAKVTRQKEYSPEEIRKVSD